MKKRMFLSCLGLLFGALTVMAQSTTHVVKRGETLTMIATQYDVSVDALKEANPLAGKSLFVGMKLQIPEKVAATPTVAEQPSVTVAVAPETKVFEQTQEPVATANIKTEKQSKWEFAAYGGLTMSTWFGDDIDKEKDYNLDRNSGNKDKYSYLFGFHVGARASFHFFNYFLAEAGLRYNRTGYKREVFDTSGSSWDDDGWNHDYSYDYTMTVNQIELPIYIGARFHDFSLKVGGYASYAFSGKEKKKYCEVDYDDIHSSATGRGTDSKSLSDLNYEEFGYGLSATVEYKFTDNLFVGATYQHGLSQLIKDTDKFNYHIMVSVGYTF